MFLAFKNGVKNMQTEGYNGARTVCILRRPQKYDEISKFFFEHTKVNLESKF